MPVQTSKILTAPRSLVGYLEYRIRFLGWFEPDDAIEGGVGVGQPGGRESHCIDPRGVDSVPRYGVYRVSGGR